MNILIIKTGAAGDVLRTTPLLRIFKNSEIDWFIDNNNKELLNPEWVANIYCSVEELPMKKYDLVVSLEDDRYVLRNIFQRIHYSEIFGAYTTIDGCLKYTDSSSKWFDMSLVSKYGIEKANELKLRNRYSYQELIFSGLGLEFKGEKYVMPEIVNTSDLRGDIAIAPKAGSRWPSKNWFYFNTLIEDLKKDFNVNVLPLRQNLRQHIADIMQHRYVISGDSLPMHIGLGLSIPTSSFFLCTSPWEIFTYGILNKLISPILGEFFYTKDYVEVLTKSIDYHFAYHTIISHIRKYL